MATKKFPSEMSSRGTVLGTDKILIYNATTGASDEVCTVAELFAYMHAAISTGSIPYKGSSVFEDSPISISGAKVSLNDSLSLTGLNISHENIQYKGQITITDPSNTGSNALSQISISAYGSDNEAGSATGRKWYVGNSTTSNNGIVLINSLEDYLAFGTNNTERVRITSTGNVAIGKTTSNYLIELNSDSAGKPGAGGLWTVVSDARIKKDIEEADLDICYDTIKNIPLKRFAWADGVYSEEQVSDRHNLGWIAQDVQKYFSKAVSVKPFTKADGEVIEDCLDLNSSQVYAALYGAVQKMQQKIESLEKEIALLKQ